jgi:anti-sigma regulatory factor (Ser/Thr protein kinase)
MVDVVLAFEGDPDHGQRGLGIFLIRKIMAEVSYNYVQGVRNELTLLKRFVSP